MAVMVNGSGVGTVTAANANSRNTATRHQPSSRFALAMPAMLNSATTSGNSNATPMISMKFVTNLTYPEISSAVVTLDGVNWSRNSRPRAMMKYASAAPAANSGAATPVNQ